MVGLIGKKLGMTQVFGESGEQVPVTVVQLGPCVVVQRKTAEKDGYDAVQLGFVEQKAHRVGKGLQGHFKRAGVKPQRILCEVRVDADSALKAGDTVTAEGFQGVEFIDVTGVCKGRGFQGVMKRHNMRGQRRTHGSTMHRRPGSIGQCESPARIVKGKRLPGQYGNTRTTVQNLKVVKVREEEGVILIRGALPGPTGGFVVIRQALKKQAKAS